MRYLHTMVRVQNLEQSLQFYCDALGMEVVRKTDHEQGRFTLVFLSAPADLANAREYKAPLIELTYNWPDDSGNVEQYSSGRNFGHLAFGVSNIYETCQKLMDKGITINRPPRDGYMAFVKSPDGISIELLQQGEALPVVSPWKDMPNTGNW